MPAQVTHTILCCCQTGEQAWSHMYVPFSLHRQLSSCLNIDFQLHHMMLRLVLCTLLALFSLSLATSQFAVFDIADFGVENLDRLKSGLETLHSSEWWIEVGDKLLALSTYPATLAIKRTTEPIFIVSKVHILPTKSHSLCSLYFDKVYISPTWMDLKARYCCTILGLLSFRHIESIS